MTRPTVSAALLLGAVNAGTHQVTLAMINPDDYMAASSDFLEQLRSVLRANALIPDASVERGWLHVNSNSVRR